jgi:hypothetical protein
LAHLHAPPAPIVDLRPDVPADLAIVLHRLLAKSRDDRFATPAEVAEALKPFAARNDLERLISRLGRRADAPRDRSGERTTVISIKALPAHSRVCPTTASRPRAAHRG